MQEPLPAPRRLLTGLFRTLAALPLPDGPEAAAAATAPPPPALASLPALRPLLATLHVLFPTLVLPALDLLDRRRVVRWAGQADGARGDRRCRPPPLYQVRGGDTPHVVYLRAWHCTCASFALRADVAWAETADDGNGDDGNDNDDDDNDDDDARLYFSTPPCRHLLACLLADAWPDGLRGCVVDGTAEAGGAPSAALLAGVVAGVQ